MTNPEHPTTRRLVDAMEATGTTRTGPPRDDALLRTIPQECALCPTPVPMASDRHYVTHLINTHEIDELAWHLLGYQAKLFALLRLIETAPTTSNTLMTRVDSTVDRAASLHDVVYIPVNLLVGLAARARDIEDEAMAATLDALVTLAVQEAVSMPVAEFDRLIARAANSIGLPEVQQVIADGRAHQAPTLGTTHVPVGIINALARHAQHQGDIRWADELMTLAAIYPPGSTVPMPQPEYADLVERFTKEFGSTAWERAVLDGQLH